MHWGEMSYNKYKSLSSQHRLEVEYESEDEYIDEATWTDWIYGEEANVCQSLVYASRT